MNPKQLLLAVIFLCGYAQAQTSADVFNEKTTITWLGIDFTAAKFIGDEDLWTNANRAHDMFEAFNTLMAKEREKYNMASALDKAQVEYALQVTTAHNKGLSIEELSTNSQSNYTMKPGYIQEIIGGYDFMGQTGIGVMLNIEAFNKTAQLCTLWVTFINMDTREVLFTEKMTEAPIGFGVRNYWAGAIYKMMKAMRKDSYDRWRKKYYRKDS